METTVGETVGLFWKHNKIKEKIETLVNLGLSYLSLGESAPFLSGGEAGGEIVAAGTFEDMKNATLSVTGKYL